jgi:hypothetical protein
MFFRATNRIVPVITLRSDRPGLLVGVLKFHVGVIVEQNSTSSSSLIL